MKTLKLIIFGLALLLISNVGKASTFPDSKPDSRYLTKNFAIDVYIDAMLHGKVKGAKDVIDADAKFSMLRGSAMVNFTKDEMIEWWSANRDVIECPVSTTVIESNDALAVVRVDMQFEGVLRTNFITVINTGKRWIITNVYSVFSQE